jgi:hypothetical protein
MKHAAAVELLDARDGRHVIDHTGGEQELAAADATTTAERDLDATRQTPRARCFLHDELHGVVGRELSPTQPAQQVRVDTVARQEAVQRPRGVIARLVRVEQEDPAAATPQNQRRAQPRGARTNDNDVEVHGRSANKRNAHRDW